LFANAKSADVHWLIGEVDHILLAFLIVLVFYLAQFGSIRRFWAGMAILREIVGESRFDPDSDTGTERQGHDGALARALITF
jgi:hypothetical protein